MNPRKTAYDMLVRAGKDEAYSNILLDSSFARSGLGTDKRAFAAALFYGVIERKITLDYIIKEYSSIKFDRIDNNTLQLLRMGLYQLMYMNIPDNAAVNETVGLAPKRSAGFINAVLRAFIRNGKTLDIRENNRLKAMAVEFSCNYWIVKMWAEQYGEDRAEDMLETALGKPPVYARVNNTVCTAEELTERLAEDGVKSVPVGEDGKCLKLLNAGAIEGLAAYRRGMFHIQDISSQRCCELLDPQPGETVIDMCAAPGGKSFTLAELMGGKGTVLSSDLYESRVGLIREGAARLGLDKIIQARVADAAVYDSSLPAADRVLCDVPCSGFGVIRRKPEIKYKKKQDTEELPAIQTRILENAANYVKPSGRLVYSTCTLRREENEEVAESFAGRHADSFTLLDEQTAFPEPDGGDGFFTAVFEKKTNE